MAIIKIDNTNDDLQGYLVRVSNEDGVVFEKVCYGLDEAQKAEELMMNSFKNVDDIFIKLQKLLNS